MLSWWCFVCIRERQGFLNKYIHSQKSQQLYFSMDPPWCWVCIKASLIVFLHGSIMVLSLYKASLMPAGGLQAERLCRGGWGEGENGSRGSSGSLCSKDLTKGFISRRDRDYFSLRESEKASQCPRVPSSVKPSWPPLPERSDSWLKSLLCWDALVRHRKSGGFLFA